MKLPKDYSTHSRTTRKELMLEYFLPLVSEFLILILCIIPFRVLKGVGPLIEEPSLVGEELTKPTAGRLAFGFLAIV